ncbi:MAG: class I SAM-dependent methyltransferase [Promethearchaeota archaeon]
MAKSIRNTILKLKVMGKALFSDIRSLDKGTRQLSERLLTQIAIKEGYPSLLMSPLTLEQIIEQMRYKNTDLAADFMKVLVEIGVIRENGGVYVWKGKKIKIGKHERRLQKIGLAFARISEVFSTYMPYALRGHGKTREFTRELLLAIWDSLYSSEFYKFARGLVIDWARLPKYQTILDIGCGTGWSTINIIQKTNAEKVFAVDRSQKAIDIAKENINITGYDDRVEFIVCNISKKPPTEKEVDGAFSSLFFHWLNRDEIVQALKNIRASLKPGAIFCGLQPLNKRTDRMAYFDVLFRASIDFKGYPQRDFFIEAFKNSNFEDLSIWSNGIFSCKAI